MTGQPGPEMAAIREKHKLIEQVACPQCGALEGWRCRTPSGMTTVVPHQQRRRAAGRAGVYKP